MGTESDRLDWQACRRLLCLPELKIDVVYHAGIKHRAADTLLRLKATGTDQTPIDEDIPVHRITPPTARKESGER